VLAGEDLRVTGDQLLEDGLGLVGGLVHRDEAVAVAQVDPGHGATVTLRLRIVEDSRRE
jgi:hypothetical protein